MEMRIHFGEKKKVIADFGPYSVVTDQPQALGGDGEQPAPFDLFLASIGTCAGVFVLGFCQKRGIPTDEIELQQTIDQDPVSHRVTHIGLEIRLPPSFPEKYRESLIRVADLCTVKKHLLEPPSIEVSTRVVVE